MNFKYSNLTHDPIRLHMDKFAINFTHSIQPPFTPLILMEIPLISDFDVEFDYSWQYNLGAGKMRIEAKNAFAYVTLKLKATEKGHLWPIIHDLKVDYWNTRLILPGRSRLAQDLYR